jgi:hypothetical protein
MRRTFSQVVAGLVVIALVAPAASAAAGQDIGRRRAASISTSTGAAPAVSAQPVSISAAVSRAVTESQGTAQAPVGPVKARGLRMQGGGKSGMVMGLASAVIGVVGMMYMMKYLKDQQKATETTPSRIR